jgi:hypothetical protein
MKKGALEGRDAGASNTPARLGRNELSALQFPKRRGGLQCLLDDERVKSRSGNRSFFKFVVSKGYFVVISRYVFHFSELLSWAPPGRKRGCTYLLQAVLIFEEINHEYSDAQI